jgi:hypothetical protein
MNTDQLLAAWLQTYAQSEGSRTVLPFAGPNRDFKPQLLCSL